MKKKCLLNFYQTCYVKQLKNSQSRSKWCQEPGFPQNWHAFNALKCLFTGTTIVCWWTGKFSWLFVIQNSFAFDFWIQFNGKLNLLLGICIQYFV